MKKVICRKRTANVHFNKFKIPEREFSLIKNEDLHKIRQDSNEALSIHY